MLAISSPPRDDTFRLDHLPRSVSDVGIHFLNSGGPLQMGYSPASSTPRSTTRAYSNKRAKLSRSTSLGGSAIVVSINNMKSPKDVNGVDEVDETIVPEDSGDDASLSSALTRATTASTSSSLCFQIPELEAAAVSTRADSTLSTYVLSTKNMIEEYDVPKNFAMVWPGVYRSSFPAEPHFPYLKMLKLKTVLTLIPEKYPQNNIEFMQANGIQHIQIGIAANKEPFVNVPLDKITRAVSIILDKRNHPILIHCNKGKHRTGCIVGCLRKLQRWSLSNVFDEYRRFSHPKERVLDEQVIELWQDAQLLTLAKANGWVSS